MLQRSGTKYESRKRLPLKRGKKQSAGRHWGCELLETRRLFATVSWATLTSGDWSTGSNWSTGQVPQPGDDVIIDTPGYNITVTYSAAAVLPLGNLLNNESLVISGSGGATWTSGTWDGSGVVHIDTKLAISGSADKTLKDGEGIDNLGTTTLSGTGNIVGVVGASITNEPGATFNVESDADITFPTGVGDGIFENGGTFIKSVGGTAPGDATEIGGAQGFRFENSINDTINLPYSIPGDCQVLQGTLEIGDNQNTALTEGGSFEVSAGATLNYDLGAANIVVLRPPNGAPNVIPSITGAGTLEVSGANVQFYGTLAIHEIDVSAGELLLQQNMQELAGTPQVNTTPNPTTYGTADIVNLSGGTLGGNGGGIFSVPSPINTEELPALVVGTTFNWTGGDLSGTGRMVIDATVTSSIISTTAAKAINGGFGLDLLCSTLWTGDGTITMNGNSALYVHGGGTLYSQNDGTITQGTVDANGGYLWNSGIVIKDGGTATTTFGPGITFINDVNPLNFVTAAIPIIDYTDPGNTSGLLAKLDIRTGTVSLQGSSINRDNFLIHPGSTLSYDAGTHQNQTYTDSNDVYDASILGVDGGGTLNFGNCTFDSDAHALVDVPTVNFGTGTYAFDNTAGGAQRVTNATFSGGGTGIITGNGTIEVTSSLNWNSGTFQGTGGTTSSLLVDSGAVLTMQSGNYDTTSGYSVDNRGTIQWANSPGILSVNGNFDQTSTGVFDTSIVNATADSLSVTGTVSLAGAFNLTPVALVPFSGETYTIINNLGAGPISGTFAGYAEGSVFTVAGDTFSVTYAGGSGNDMVLTSLVPPTVTVETPRVLVRPLSGTSVIAFTVDLSAAASVAVSVNYTTTPGTARPGVDYVTTAGTLVIPAGKLSETVSVPIIGTTAVESAVTFTLTLSNPTSCVLGNPSSAVATIASLNGPPALAFSPTAYVVDENAGFVTVVVTSSNPRIASSVAYTTVDGTAIAGVDYVATSGVLTLAAGVSQTTFQVPIIDRGLTQGQTVFTIVLSNPIGNGATLGAATAAVGIYDNDGAAPTLSIGNATVSEFIYGQTDAVFNLNVSAPSTSKLSVQYTTADGTAAEGKYVPESGTITFLPGQTSAQITVPVNSDFVQTTTETFYVNLSNPVNITLGNATGIGTILSESLTTVPISAGHAFRYLNAAGRHTTISLAGPGSGVITYLGSTIDDGKQIVLNNTTAQSVLSVRTDGGHTTIVDIIVNGSLGTINAPVLSLFSDLTVTGGLQNLRLGSLLGGNTVSIGSGGGISSLGASFTDITDASVTSALPLTNVHVNSWTDASGGAGITAPSARSITSAQAFNADITLAGGLNSLAVRGSLHDSMIRVGGSINSLSAAELVNDDIFAGAVSNLVTLPADASAFTNTTSTIQRLSVTSRVTGAFANTLIAAPIIGNVQLGSIATANGGTPFGVVGTSIRSVLGRVTRPIRLTDAGLLSGQFSDGDFVVHL